jgi:hypothetical protein
VVYNDKNRVQKGTQRTALLEVNNTLTGFLYTSCIISMNYVCAYVVLVGVLRALVALSPVAVVLLGLAALVALAVVLLLLLLRTASLLPD